MSLVVLVGRFIIIPSEKESFGLVAIEAMASGVPVIGSNTGGLPEVVEHGETGYLPQLETFGYGQECSAHTDRSCFAS